MFVLLVIYCVTTVILSNARNVSSKGTRDNFMLVLNNLGLMKHVKQLIIIILCFLVIQFETFCIPVIVYFT